jgi:hypothetical protein
MLPDAGRHTPGSIPSAEHVLGERFLGTQACGMSVSTAKSTARFLLWADAVGGYLVCQGDEVRLGQAIPGSEVEVPLLADLSRHHATIRRDGGVYLLEPLREARVNGRTVQSVTTLASGSLIELGPALRMRFTMPHPLCATARLDVVSRHQTRPSTDAILLMADTLVLGPASRNHVVCRDWPQDVVLFRQQREMLCRTTCPFEVSGTHYERRGPLTLNSRVIGEGFSFSLEQI